MEEMRTLVSRHKKISPLTLFALIVFADSSATSAVNVAHQRAAEEATKTELVDEQGMSDDGKDTEEKVKLSSSRKKLIDGYDDETKKPIETLSTSVFSANNGRNTLRFHDDYYVETMNDKEQNHSCIISTVEFDNNSSDNEIDHIVFETDTGTHTTTFTLVIGADSTFAGECTIISTSMLKLTDIPYERGDAVKKVSVTGFNSETTELLGDTDGMEKQLSNWCFIHFLVAATATWTGTCNIDYNEDTVSTAFAIGDDNSNEATGNTGASISVAYGRSEKKYSFSM